MNDTNDSLPTDTRRSFIKKSALGAAGIAVASTAKSYASVIGANDTLHVALAGFKRRGKPLMDSLAKVPNVKLTYLIEVDSRQMDAGMKHAEEVLGYKPKAEKDIRKVVEQKDVDAIMIATPDHLHAYEALLGLKHGKHVYVEKPCAYNLDEDRMLLKAEKKYSDLKIQMGSQQRSSRETQEIVAQIHEGVIGDPYKAVAFYNNARGRVANPKVVAPPKELDWELWQGPAPRTDFIDIVEDYNWHWRWHWGTAESANNGTHELDVARWALGVVYPEEVRTISGKHHFADDGWEMYDTMEATYRFAGNKVIQWDGKSRNGYQTYQGGRGLVVYGSEGSVHLNRGGYRLYDRKGDLIRETLAGTNEGGIALGGGGGMTDIHVRNWVNAIRKGEKLAAPMKEGVPSTHLTHYANISSRAGDALVLVDSKTGKMKDKELVKKYDAREYEPGWELSV